MTDQPEQELKPCPFCGVVFLLAHPDAEYLEHYETGCFLDHSLIKPSEWNTRSPTPAQPSAVIEAAAKICDELEVVYHALADKAATEKLTHLVDAYINQAVGVKRAGVEIRAMPLPDAVSIDGKGGNLVERIGLAEWGATDAMSAKDHAKHFEQSVEKTAETFDQDRPQRLHGLYIKGTKTVICHTGTSPNSGKIARKLEGLWNGSAQTSNTASLAVIKGLVEYLESAKKTFSRYAALHSAKKTGDGDSKAFTNAQMANNMADAIATATAHIEAMADGS